jgi:DNA-binding NarL/FixJ family response regulator
VHLLGIFYYTGAYACAIPGIINTLVRWRHTLFRGREGAMDWDRFASSTREKQVVELLLEGLSHGEIGRRHFISAGTVKTHVLKAYRKSGAANKMELARFLRDGPPPTKG